MNEIMKAAYKSAMPKLDVKIGIFKHKVTKELGFMVSQVNNTHYVYDASQWTFLLHKEVEGTDRIWKVMTDEMIKQMEQSK